MVKVNVSREATVIVARCKQTKQPFGIRMEKMSDGAWHCTWAFKITDKAVSHEKYEDTMISGRVELDPEYPGCPYCGGSSWFKCNCNDKITCWNGESKVTCAWCGETSDVAPADKFDLRGSGY